MLLHLHTYAQQADPRKTVMVYYRTLKGVEAPAGQAYAQDLQTGEIKPIWLTADSALNEVAQDPGFMAESPDIGDWEERFYGTWINRETRALEYIPRKVGEGIAAYTARARAKLAPHTQR